MVVLLIGMAVTAVGMSALLPAWRQQATREREEELIYRGTQYARAIFLYNQKTGTFPTDIDTLVSQKYLRKKYLDPITGKDFIVIAGAAPGQGGSPGGATGRGTGTPGAGLPASGGRSAAPPAGGTAPGGARPPASGGAPVGGGSGSGQMVGGIQGVYSASNATSIKIYRGAQEYDQWLFRYSDVAAQMRGGQGQQGPGAAGPGRGGNPNGAGGNGQGGPAGQRGVGRGPGGPGGGGPGVGAPVPGRGGGRGGGGL